MAPLARRRTLAALALACVAPRALAQQGIVARQNLEYRLIAPQPVETPGQIEVIDFFWYGCPACNALQPALEHWIKRKPADVAVRRVPAIFRESWVPHVRIYYTLERLGEIERLHQQVYFSYHTEELALSKPEVAEGWAVRSGIDRKKWQDAYNSSEVTARIERAKQLTAAYDVRGTPSLVVNGRYLTAWDMADHNPVVMVAILEELIRLSRQKPPAG